MVGYGGWLVAVFVAPTPPPPSDARPPSRTLRTTSPPRPRRTSLRRSGTTPHTALKHPSPPPSPCARALPKRSGNRRAKPSRASMWAGRPAPSPRVRPHVGDLRDRGGGGHRPACDGGGGVGCTALPTASASLERATGATWRGSRARRAGGRPATRPAAARGAPRGARDLVSGDGDTHVARGRGEPGALA